MNSTDINQTFDLLTLVSSPLRKAGEYHIGACPFCGGRDRFTVKHTNEGDRWYCRHCGDGKYHTVIDFIMRRDGCDFKAAFQNLGGDPTRSQTIIHTAPIQRPDNPPCETWQTSALQLIERAEFALWDKPGIDTMTRLRSRGLSDETIHAARLGYIPKDHTQKPEIWGTPNDNPLPIYFFEGLLIPGIISSKVWYLKMRPVHSRNKMPKYINVRGGKSASLYLADSIANGRPAVFCEGELDALLTKQQAKELISPITLGSATNKLNIATWGIYLAHAQIPSYLIAYDADKAGKKGGDDLTWLHDSQRLHIPVLRTGDKDLSDFHISGGNLYSLIKNAIRPETPIFINWSAGVNPATIHGQYWQNPDNQIEAFYLPDELDQCLKVMQVISDPA